MSGSWPPPAPPPPGEGWPPPPGRGPAPGQGWRPPSTPPHPYATGVPGRPAYPVPAGRGPRHPVEPVEYHVLHRAGRRGWAWGLLGMVLCFVGVFLVAQLVLMVPFAVYFAVRGEGLAAVESLVDFSDPRPAALAFLMLSLASAIPVVWAVTRLLHALRPGWVTSVRPRMRWGYFLVCIVLSVVALGATLLVSLVLPHGGAGAEITGELNELTPRLRDFVLIVVLLTPFQAAGEEYLFRGYLTQAVGGMADTAFGRTASRVLAVVVPALIFAVFHGLSQSVPVFFDRFAFGVIAGILVIVTGGLEAGIAMHVLNNLLAFGLALAFGDLGSALQPTGGTWWMLPSTLTQSLVYLALAWTVARAMGLNRAAEPAVLAASTGHVYRSSSVHPER